MTDHRHEWEMILGRSKADCKAKDCQERLFLNQIVAILNEHAKLLDALEHCGYDPTDCIDCGGPPHNEHCRFWKLRHLGLWGDAHADTQEQLTKDR